MSTLSALPPDVYSPDQLGAALLELQDHMNTLRDEAVRQKVGRAANKAAVPLPVSPALSSLLTIAGIAPDDATALEALSADLEILRTQAPVAHLIFAAQPNTTLKRQLVSWFRQEIHPACLLTFAARSDLAGGIVIQTGSHVYDCSFRQRILATKAEISRHVR